MSKVITTLHVMAPQTLPVIQDLKCTFCIFRYRYYVYWLSEGLECPSRNCTNLLQWESMV